MSVRKMTFTTRCVESTAEAIQDMVDRARKITLKTMRKHCNIEPIEKKMGYAMKGKEGLSMEKDWHLKFYRSRYLGRPCYFFVHSCIEYVFT